MVFAGGVKGNVADNNHLTLILIGKGLHSGPELVSIGTIDILKQLIGSHLCEAERGVPGAVGHRDFKYSHDFFHVFFDKFNLVVNHNNYLLLVGSRIL